MIRRNVPAWWVRSGDDLEALDGCSARLASVSKATLGIEKAGKSFDSRPCVGSVRAARTSGAGTAPNGDSDRMSPRLLGLGPPVRCPCYRTGCGPGVRFFRAERRYSSCSLPIGPAGPWARTPAVGPCEARTGHRTRRRDRTAGRSGRRRPGDAERRGGVATREGVDGPRPASQGFEVRPGRSSLRPRGPPHRVSARGAQSERAGGRPRPSRVSMRRGRPAGVGRRRLSRRRARTGRGEERAGVVLLEVEPPDPVVPPQGHGPPVQGDLG
jgi:hypothetical protein